MFPFWALDWIWIQTQYCWLSTSHMVGALRWTKWPSFLSVRLSVVLLKILERRFHQRFCVDNPAPLQIQSLTSGFLISSKKNYVSWKLVDFADSVTWKPWAANPMYVRYIWTWDWKPYIFALKQNPMHCVQQIHRNAAGEALDAKLLIKLICDDRYLCLFDRTRPSVCILKFLNTPSF